MILSTKMPLSSIVKNHCDTCGKIAIEVSRLDLGSSKLISLECGHVYSEKILTESEYSAVKSSDGRSLMPFQVEGIKFVENSNCRALIADEQGLGKFQDVDSLVITPSGYKRIGDIQVNDEIINSHGYTSHVIGVYPQGIKSIYEVVFNDGARCNSGLEHLWAVNTPIRQQRDNPYVVKTLQQILDEGLRLKHNFRHRIPITEPIHFNAQEVKISPYALGLLIGDGGLSQFNRVTYTSVDNDLILSVDCELVKFGTELKHDEDCNYHVQYPKPIIEELNKLELQGHKSNEKFIPDIYKFNSAINRLAILQGVMDTDGSISAIGVTEFVSTSKRLCDDVKFIVQSLGGVAYYSAKQPHYTYKGEYKTGLLAHKLIVNIPINPFFMQRKSSKWKPNPKYRPIRCIEQVNYIGDKECVCIATDAPDRLYLTNECIVTHNTVSACGLLSLHRELLPAIIVTKTTIKKQWMYELIRWIGSRKVQVISSSKETAVDGFDFYVTTYDMIKNEDMFSDINPQTLILDECQAIKNHLSGRAKAIQKISSNIPHILALSGTPIKNNAGEYFTILNLLQPTRFPEFNRYIRDYCDNYETLYGYKVGGLSSIEHFQSQTSDFIIRRTQSEVLPDLFALKQPRKFQHVEMDGKFKRAYMSAMKELDDLMYAEESENTTTAMIAIMTKMRQITGLSKTVEAVDLAVDHILSTGRKIIIFGHHHAAIDLLENNLNVWLKDGGYNPCVMFRAGDIGSDKVKQFSQDNTPIAIGSTLASGEGLDGLQKVCSDMILLERQWNPANEEQVEGRLGRIGQEHPVNFIYMIASGTIDELFTQLVEEKRAYVASALDGQVIQWSEQSLMKELAQLLVSTGQKPWSL